MTSLILIAAALLLPQEKNEAEELFKKMEGKVTKAKSVHIKMAGRMDPEGLELTGELWLDDGNRGRCELKAKKDQETDTALLISDGKKVQMSGSGGKENRPFDAPESIVRLMRICASRAGVMGTLDASQREEKAKVDPETAFTASDFKLGAKEKVADRESQAISYKLTRKGEQEASVTVWIDTETHLPLKRSMKKGSRTLTETYTEFTLDGKIDAAKFELTK
jgi:outer membrane lipoprotein-sorting protein